MAPRSRRGRKKAVKQKPAPAVSQACCTPVPLALPRPIVSSSTTPGGIEEFDVTLKAGVMRVAYLPWLAYHKGPVDGVDRPEFGYKPVGWVGSIPLNVIPIAVDYQIACNTKSACDWIQLGLGGRQLAVSPEGTITTTVVPRSHYDGACTQSESFDLCGFGRRRLRMPADLAGKTASDILAALKAHLILWTSANDIRVLIRTRMEYRNTATCW